MINKQDWLALGNSLLANFEQHYSPQEHSAQNIFIIGAPRSGTTILNQSMLSSFEFGYVDNLMASFWQAPVFGAELSNKLIKNRVISSASNFGQTELITDPHEFGGFWRDILGYTGMEQKQEHYVDWDNLNNTLDQVAAVFNKPMLYKVFQLYWHLSEYHTIKPNSKWIWIEREPVANIKSILKLRQAKTGSMDKWVSAKPLFSKLFDGESNLVQVASQVLGINHWIEKELSKIHSNSWYKVKYDDFIKAPEKILTDISVFLNIEFNEAKMANFIHSIKNIPTEESNPAIVDAIDYVNTRLTKLS